ncbi:MAG: DNA polymerase III subunit delta [Eubacterium sp.]|nr:DNA polymerase III subunit delta [Eubacterium sp.]
MKRLKELEKSIKEENFYKVYLFTGDEGYLLKQAGKMLRRALTGPDDTMNYMAYANEFVDIPALKDLADTFPFFAPKRLIVLDSTDILKTGKDAFLSLMKDMPDTTVLLILEAEADKRTKAYKWIKKNGYTAEFLKKNQSEDDLIRTVALWLRQSGKKIRKEDALYILSRAGTDLFTLKNETDKLAAYLGDRDEVTREAIDAILSVETENRIFEMTDAVSAGNTKKALKQFEDLMVLKEQPLRVLALVVRQYRILSLVADMESNHVPETEMARAAGLQRFVIRRYRDQIRRIRAKDPAALYKDCFAECIEADQAVKTGKMEGRTALETLLVSLCRKMKG